jgi:hypothetical protein
VDSLIASFLIRLFLKKILVANCKTERHSELPTSEFELDF